MSNISKYKNGWFLLLFIMIGIVLGGLIAESTAGIESLSWLSYGNTFGLDSPLVINLGVLVITFALQIKITIASIIGVILAIIITRLYSSLYKDYPFVRKGQTYEHKKQLYTHRKNGYRFTSL